MSLNCTNFFEKTGFTSKTHFCILLKTNLTHQQLQYKIGLNENSMKFDTFGMYNTGGLYFTTEEHLHKLVYFDANINIATIELCEDTQFHIDPESFLFRADKFNITNIYQSEEICKLVVRQRGLMLKNVLVKTPEICRFALESNVFALEFIIDQTEEMCLFAVRRNAFVLEFIKEQTEEMCIIAVRQNGWALRLVKTQTKNICEIVKRRIEDKGMLAVNKEITLMTYCINIVYQ